MDLLNILNITFDFEVFLKNKQNFYYAFNIKSSNGKIRRINAPKKKLSEIQYIILSLLENNYYPPSCVQGYVKNKSIKTNALLHVKKNLILNIDIKNFFNHIKKETIIENLKSYLNLSEQDIIIISELVTLNDCLPQGSPTSPILSNIVCNDLDTKLSNLAVNYKFNYSRYGDDITFSTNSKYFPKEIYLHSQFKISDEVIKIFNQNNFIINKQKLKLRHSKQHQEVTGITVNKKTNIDRKYIRNIRATLHNIKKNGFDSEANKWILKYSNRNLKDKYLFKRSILGKINYIGFIKGKNNKTYQNLLIKYYDTFK